MLDPLTAPEAILLIRAVPIILLSLFAFYFLVKALRKDHKEAMEYVKTVYAGIIGGLVLAIAIEINKNNFYDYALILALMLFIVSITAYSTVTSLSTRQSNQKTKSTKKRIYFWRILKGSFAIFSQNTHENNIKVRERHETEIRRQLQVILTILLLIVGGTLTSQKTISGVAGWSVLTIIFLIIYVLVDGTYLSKYAEYTDELIKKKKD